MPVQSQGMHLGLECEFKRVVNNIIQNVTKDIVSRAMYQDIKYIGDKRRWIYVLYNR